MNRGYKWILLAMLACAFFFHQADRVLFGLLTIPIQKDLGLTDLQIGIVNSSLFCTLAVMIPIAGFVGDRFSRKWIITLSLLFWSLMTACTGFVGGMCGLVFFRSIATGGGESFYSPSAFALIAGHHKSTRSIALGIHQSALYLGLMFSGALVAWVLAAFGGWRPVFLAFGACGFLLGVVFVFALGNVRTEGRSSVSAGTVAALRAYFGNRSALLATAGLVAIIFANNAYLSWMPKFAAVRFSEELDVGSAGFGTMFWHHIAAFAAILAGGLVADAMARRNARCRLIIQGAAMLLGAPVLAYVGSVPSVAVLWMAVAAYGVSRGFAEANSHANLLDVMEPRYRSSAEGLSSMIAFFLGSLSPLMFGWLSDRFGVGGFRTGFAVLGIGYAIGALCLFASAAFTFNKDRVSE